MFVFYHLGFGSYEIRGVRLIDPIDVDNSANDTFISNNEWAVDMDSPLQNYSPRE